MGKVQEQVKHNRLVKAYQLYKKECVKAGVLHRDFEDWKEYYAVLPKEEPL